MRPSVDSFSICKQGNSLHSSFLLSRLSHVHNRSTVHKLPRIWPFRDMDGLSAAASIIAVLQLTGVVIGYLNDVKDAPKECQQCTIEASNIQILLIQLRYRLEQGQTGNPWFTAVQALNIENGPLHQYRQALEQLQSKVLVQDGVQTVKRRLLWKFRKEEAAGILARIERLKSLVNIALEMDHL